MFSFINTAKYPPSLLFMAMTIGPGILFLAFAEKFRNVLSRIIIVFGRVPFFFYVLHFYLLHLLCMIMFLARGNSLAEGIHEQPSMIPNFIKPGEGYDLLTTYLIWILVIVMLYPLCRWFDDYKKTHKNWWVSFL